MDNPAAAAEQFKARGNIVDIREHGSGNINDTFLVSLDKVDEKHFILQRLNTRVFREPQLIMRNLRIFTEHARQQLLKEKQNAGRCWQVPRVLSAADGRDHWLDPAGSFWRAISYIEAAQSFETVRNPEHADEVGYALGMFHRLLADLPAGQLADTLAGFHVTPLYLRHFHELLARHAADSSPAADYCLRFISERSAWAPVLENARQQGVLRLRPIHGDPKINNIMIDTATGQAVSIVDLDTVKPGLVHYDIGDCLRSGCNIRGEDAAPAAPVRFDIDICRAILQGYFQTAGSFPAEKDYDYLFDAIRLIAFELGLRYFSDFLEGNVYFKVAYQEQNLARALVQFRLTESIEAQEREIRGIIDESR